MSDLLFVRDLTVSIGAGRPVDGVSFDIAPGETFALLGESGCGKSMTALALMRLLPAAARIAGGAVSLGGRDLLALPEAEMRTVRGAGMGMIFQEPATSLNPVMTVGRQIGEALALRGCGGRERALELLAAVGIPDPARRLDEYPFQMSGGMKQRVMIAMALAGTPQLLIADEPTTALDVTIQAQVLDLLKGLQRERGMAMLLITHDLGVVARMADRVGVMYAGQLVEVADRERFFAAPAHPYSRRLFAALPDAERRGGRLVTIPGSVPRLDAGFTGCRFAARCGEAMAVCRSEAPPWRADADRRMRCHLALGAGGPLAAVAPAAAPARDRAPGAPLLEIDDLAVHFPIRRGLFKRTVGQVRAVDGISLRLAPGRTLALVGESGCGKTTAGKAILRLVAPTGGTVRLEGRTLDAATIAAARASVQMVFQDPFGSLNPRLRIGAIIAEGMEALGVPGDHGARIAELLGQVGLAADMAGRYPHEFSGGQRQRIAIARALAVAPKLLVLDEPTSALDVSVQAQILNLLADLQKGLGLAYLFITHNIAVVDYLADEVAVMYLGRIVERGSAEQVLRRPRHPYTQALLAAVPRLDGRAGESLLVPGDPPSPANPPAGCHFHPRCPRATETCRAAYPEATEPSPGHAVRCWHAGP